MNRCRHIRRLASFAAVWTCAVLLAGALADEEPFFKAYPVNGVPEQEVMDTLNELAGKGGRVFADRTLNRVFVMGTSNAHSQVEAILKELDIPPRNVRLDITTSQAISATDNTAALNASGRVRVTQNGTSVRLKMEPQVTAQSLTGGSLTSQTLVVADGEEASLIIGEEVPYWEWLEALARSQGYVARDQTLREVGAFLWVCPRIIGNGPLIRLRFTPELRALDGGRPARVRFIKMATAVTVRAGATFSVGGLSKGSEFYRKFLTGAGRSGASEGINMSITPTILDLSGKPAN